MTGVQTCALPIYHDGLPLAGNGREVREQLLLAVEAPVERIGPILVPLELIGPYDQVWKTDAGRRVECGAAMVVGGIVIVNAQPIAAAIDGRSLRA